MALYPQRPLDLPKRNARQVALAAHELAEAGATPEQVAVVVKAWRAHPTYKECALTPHGLVSHFVELLPALKAPPAPAFAPEPLGQAESLAAVRGLRETLGGGRAD